MILGKNRLWGLCIGVLLVGILLYLLYWRWQVSQIRYFDIDEFLHLHLTAELVRGERLYIDFITYFSPGFMWVLAPLFWIYGVSFQIFIAARELSFCIFLALLFVLCILFGYTRSWRWALLPVIILAFLPMPYDKFLEVRPDTIATLLACAALLTEVIAIRKIHVMRLWCLCGFLYGISFLFLIKMAPFLLAGWIVAMVVSFQRVGTKNKKTAWANLIAMTGGLLIALCGFFGWAALTGGLQVTLYSVVQMPFEISNHFQGGYYLAPFLFFYPNALFYGGDGVSLSAGLLMNNALWIFASMVGVYRLLTPYLKAQGNREKMQIELLLALTFVFAGIGFIKFSPVKYSQYLIPTAVFIAYYAADGISLFFDWLASVGGYPSLAIALVGLGYVLVTVTQSINAPKILSTNAGQRTEFDRLLATVPLSARVVDLEGKMIFWPDGYPMCCMSLEDFVPYISHGPPSLATYLSLHLADYLYDGTTNRLTSLFPENVAYIKSHFALVPGWGSSLWKRIQ